MDITLLLVNRSGVPYTELAEANLSTITWKLLEPDTFDITIDPVSEDALGIFLVKREVQVWFDDVLVGWGVPWGISGGPRQITISFEGIESLLKKRYVDRMSLDYDSIDQLAIGWDLVSYAQDESFQGNRDLNISSAVFSASGVPRSPRYNRDEHKNILDLLYEFPEMNNGFEWAIVPSVDGSQRLWTPYFPQKGTLKPNFNIEWTTDGTKDIEDFEYTEDALPLATNAYVTGGSEGDVRFEQNYEDVSASEEYGVMQEVISDGGQKDVGWLLDRAVREVNTRKQPQIDIDITKVDLPDDRLLGAVETGDRLPVFIDHGRIQFDSEKRIKEMTWNKDHTMVLSFLEAIT